MEEMNCIVVGEATTFDEAVVLVKETHPDVVLMDIGINGALSGIDTAEYIQENYNTPIIFITGNSDKATLKAANRTNPLGFIFKPIDEVRLKRDFIKICKRLN